MGYSFDRYVKRIFIPLAAVAGLAIVLRFIAINQFVDQNVEVAELHPPQATEELEIPHFSEENRTEAVTSLEAAKTQLDSNLDSRVQSKQNEALGNARELAEKVDASIEKLKGAEASNWKELRKEAFDSLDEYSRSVYDR